MVIHYSAFRAHDAPVLGTHDVAIPNGGVRTLTCAVSGPTGLRSKTFIIYGNNVRCLRGGRDRSSGLSLLNFKTRPLHAQHGLSFLFNARRASAPRGMWGAAMSRLDPPYT